MKKILLAFDGTQFSEGAFEFARHLNELEPVLITGVFMPQVSYANLWSYTGAMVGPIYVPLIEDDEADVIERNIAHFEELCRKNDISYRVHKDYTDFALPELRTETRFADLLILSGEKFYYDIAGENAIDYLADALKETECPVIIVSEKSAFPQTTILAYDGSASSVFAIKQFAYLFPELSQNETLLVYVKENGTVSFPDESNIEELATQHFKNLTLQKLDMNADKYFADWINENTNAMLVTGAFGRSFFSQLVRPGFITKVIASHKLPVFVSHK